MDQALCFYVKVGNLFHMLYSTTGSGELWPWLEFQVIFLATASKGAATVAGHNSIPDHFDSGTGKMEKQRLSGLHQDPIGSTNFSYAEAGMMVPALRCPPCCLQQLSYLCIQVGLFVPFCHNLVGCPAIGLRGAWSLIGGVQRFQVARPSGTSGLQAQRDCVVPACWVAVEASLRCLYSSGPSPLTFKAPVPKLINLR